MTYQKTIGKWGEQLAINFLSAKGYSLVDKNIFTPYGEIDLLMSFEKMLVFIEVKTRTSNSFGFPELSISKKKLLKMQASAEHYLQKLGFSGTWQLDAIAIVKIIGENPEITHFENVQP